MVRNTEFEDYKVAESAYYSDMDTMAQIEENERNEMINKTLDMMPKDESVLLSLYYLEDNSVKDIAIITNLTEANVKVKLHRARKRFAEIASQQMRI